MAYKCQVKHLNISLAYQELILKMLISINEIRIPSTTYITDNFLKIGLPRMGKHLQNLALEFEESSEGVSPPRGPWDNLQLFYILD